MAFRQMRPTELKTFVLKIINTLTTWFTRKDK